MSSEIKQCKNCHKDFTIEPEDFEFFKSIEVPVPTFCSDCRSQRRMTWRNERTLHRQECGLCKRPIISIYKKQSPYTVYCHTCFRSDKWDPMSFGRDYDFSKPFFSQFHELQKDVPRLYAMVTECVDSEYINGAYRDKNCYLIFASDHDEDSAYSHSIFYCKNVYDCLGVRHSELSIGCVDCEKISNSAYSQDCADSYNIYFCKNCTNCHDCIGSTNLHNKQFCIFNKQLTKEEYAQKAQGMHLERLSNFSETVRRSREAHAAFPMKYYHGKNNVNSQGDYIVQTKNCVSVFDGQEVENCKYLYIVNKVKDSYDGYAVVENVEKNFEVISHNSSFSKFCLSFWSGSYGTYGDTCENCTNVFGCIGLRNKQYCILNKQYTKEEYESLVPKIIEHMNMMPYVDKNNIEYRYGEYFPTELSPYAYNETVAQEFFPQTKEEISNKTLPWFEQETRNYTITKQYSELPDSITDIDDSICKETIACAHEGECAHQCATAFRIIPEELKMYKRMNLPLPRLCPNCRHYERIQMRNPMKLWHRSCQCAGTKSENGIYINSTKHQHEEGKCPNEFETSYSPESPAIVYCEQCYQAEVA